METATRDGLVAAYYDAIDAESFAEFERVFATDVEYRYPGEPTMRGPGSVRAFFEERRTHSNSTHELHRRVVDDEATVCEGVVRADGDDGSRFEAGFVGVFTFDADAETITSVGVYTRE